MAIDASVALTPAYRGTPWRAGVAAGLRAVRVMVAVAAAAPIVAYVVVAAQRLGYPYELEWLEGGAAEMVRRVVAAQPLYAAPSIHYVAYPYTPLYFWVCALVAHVTGVGFLPLRLVSFVSSLGCLALLFHLVRRQTQRPLAGLVAAGLFAATYQLCLAWFDIGRVDSLALFLVLATVALARRAGAVGAVPGSPGVAAARRQVAWGVAVGVVAFAAFFTKQSGVVAVAPVLVFLAVRRPWAGLPALGTTAALVAGSTVALDHATHGWYGWFVFDELTRQGVNRAAILGFVPDDLVGPLACATALGVVGFAYCAWQRRHRAARRYWAVAAAGLVASSYLGELHSGGAGDVLMPAFAGVALIAGLGFGWLAEAVAPPGARRLADAGGPWPTARVVAGPALAAGLVVAQLALLGYNPGAFVPTSADAAAGRRFVALVAARPGAVLVYDHPWYATMGGKPAFAQGEAVHDVLRAGPSPARTELLASLASALRTGRLTTVFADDRGGELRRWLDQGWEARPVRYACGRCFYPPSDLAERPAVEYVRTRSGTAGPG